MPTRIPRPLPERMAISAGRADVRKGGIFGVLAAPGIPENSVFSGIFNKDLA